jgi:hypothetical protein
MWVAYLDSSHFSEHFSYIIYFHPTYSLFYMILRSFIEFLEFPGINFNSKLNIKILNAPSSVYTEVYQRG